MVRRGQYLERAVVVVGEPPLEGLYHRGQRGPGVLIAPPHPERGGTMESPVIAEMAWALTRAGHPTLRFNYQGVGASPGDFGPEAAFADTVRAADHLHASLDPAWSADPMGGLGLGWGALALAPLVHAGRLDPFVWIHPDDPDDLAALEGWTGALTVVMPFEVERAYREAVIERVDAFSQGRWSVIPHADTRFNRGLVELGKVVTEAFSPEDLMDLG